MNKITISILIILALLINVLPASSGGYIEVRGKIANETAGHWIWLAIKGENNRY